MIIQRSTAGEADKSMIQRKSRIAIVGAGLGGSAVAALLQSAGFNVTVYEQTPTFSRLGAGIHLGPNTVKVLQRIGIAEQLADTGCHLEAWISRKCDTGETLLNHKFDATRYGAPYIQAHRGDFHELLIDALKPGTVEFGKCLVDLDVIKNVVHLGFEDGTKASADVVIGADGVQSKVREILVGLEQPKYIGQVAHRFIIPSSALGDLEHRIPSYTKWWGEVGEDRMVNHYFLTSSRKEFFVYTSSPEPEWQHETSSVPADLDSLRAAFEDYHPNVRRMLEVCTEATKWPQFYFEPLPLWSRGPIVMLGDACHPMTPYMGQGAAMAIEDSAVLSRCMVSSPSDFDYAFKLYEANRKDRTAKVQSGSREHKWLRDKADPDWVWGYDAVTEPLVTPEH